MKRALILMVVPLALPALASGTEETPKAKETPKTEEAPKTKETPRTEQTPDTEATHEAGGTFEVLGAKVCASVENKECTTEQAAFNAGDKAWLWLKLRPIGESATLSLKWSRDGKHVWTMDPTPVRLGRTWYYKTFDQPGEWKVELLDNSQTVLHTATVTVSGEPTGTTTEAATGGAAATDVAASENIEVVDLKLAETIENREPVSPATTFAAGSKVYTWVKLNVKAPETAVKFKWYNGDALVYTSDPINVRQSPGWRTWLYKTVEEAGAWKVEVVDADDKALRGAEFTVQ